MLEYIGYKGSLHNSRVVVNIEQNTKHTYEYGDKCVWIWRRREMRIHVYIHVRRN